MSAWCDCHAFARAASGTELDYCFRFTRDIYPPLAQHFASVTLGALHYVQIRLFESVWKARGRRNQSSEVLASVRAAEPDWKLWLVLGEDGPLAAIARDLGVNVIVQPFPAALARLGDAGRLAGWPFC